MTNTVYIRQYPIGNNKTHSLCLTRWQYNWLKLLTIRPSIRTDMFLLTLIICQTVLASAKVLHFKLDREFESDNDLPFAVTTEQPSVSDVPIEMWDDPLWVIKFDESLNITHLKTSSIPEEEYFDTTFGPMLHRFPLLYYEYKEQQQASRREKKDDPNKSYASDNFFDRIHKDNVKTDIFTDKNAESDMDEVKFKIIQMINKFVLSLKDEHHTNLPESMDAYDQPVLRLYFKGPFTVLMVNYERMEWHFILTQPSPLPQWFYNEHPDRTIDKYGMYVKIPAAVKEEFFAKFLHLITRLFGFPI